MFQKIILILIILFLLVDIKIAKGEEIYSTDAIVDAIYLAEGGLKTFYPFGIVSIYCEGYDNCRQICYNTIENTKSRFKMWGYKQEKNFLTFLAKRYCPDDWETWLKNVRYFLGKK